MTKRFSASSAGQLMQCSGSANLELAIPGYEEPTRDDMAGAKGVGTNVHNVLEQWLQHGPARRVLMRELLTEFAQLHWRLRRPITDTEADCRKWVLDAWNGVLRTRMTVGAVKTVSTIEDVVQWFMLIGEGLYPPAMLKFIISATLYVDTLMDALGAGLATVYTELNMTADWLKTKPGTTADVVINTGYRLDVIDYKSGKIPVSPIDNDQLNFYALSAYYALQSKAEVIVVHIVQPGNRESFAITVEDLLLWKEQAIAAEQRILNKDLTLTPGDHCTFCPANPHSRGDKAKKLCPPMMELLYPAMIDLDEIF